MKLEELHIILFMPNVGLNLAAGTILNCIYLIINLFTLIKIQTA